MTEPSSRLRTGVLAAILAIAALAYLPAAGGSFQWDDDVSVIGNPRVLDPSLIKWRLFVPPVLGRDRALTDVTFALNYMTTGAAKAPFVAVNVAIHLAAVMLAWAVARAILRRARSPRAGWLALAVAALFALHPLQTEAVAYVAQRSESLASALFLAAVLLALRADERYAAGARWAGWGAVAAVAFVAGVAAKPIAITAPAVFIVIVAVTARPGERSRGYWAALLGPIAVAVVLGIGGVATLRGTDVGVSGERLGPWRYLLTEASVVLRYAGLLFWPPAQSVDHAVRGSPGLADPVTLGCVAAVLAILAFALWLARQARRTGEPAAAAAAIGILWFLCVLAPTSTLVQLNDPMAEHRTYLANAGAFLALVAGVDHLLRRSFREPVASRAGLALASVALLALAGALVPRARAWSDPVALWTDAARKAPASYRPHQHAANALLAAGRREEALEHYRRALQTVPRLTEAFTMIVRAYALALASAGRLADARAALEAALAECPDHAGLREKLALVLYGSGDDDAALAAVARARLAGPDSADLATVAGKIAATRGDLGTALRELARAVELEPESAMRRSDLAIVSRMAGDGDRACAEIAAFLRLEKGPGPLAEGVRLQREWGCPGR